MLFEEKTIDSQNIYKGRFLELKQDKVCLPNGKQSIREYVIHPGAMMIIPILPDGQVVLERQYRYPVRELMIEFPAGKLDPGESALNCAKRELFEETGYKAKNWAYAGQVYPCIGYSNEVIEIWLAKDLVAGPPQLDEGEFVEIFTASIEQLKQWMFDGIIKDAKTLAGLHWLFAYHHNELSLRWNEEDDATSGDNKR